MDFDYKEIDQEGLETLEAITDADQFNRWMYNSIRRYCSGKILEIGSGIGNISQFFVENKADIYLTDIRDNYLDALADRFPSTPQVKIDLIDPDFDQKHKNLLGTFDTVFALNVVEHIKEDQLAMINIKKLLKSGGNAVILVPAFQSLYNGIDKELYHYRRYTRKALNKLFQRAEYTITNSHYFNSMGIPAWFIGGKLMGDKTIKKSKMGLYNSLVPLFKIIDIPLKKLIGLSVITVGRK